MGRIRLLLSSAMTLALMSSNAFAEGVGHILIRGNTRDGSTRIVMAAPSAPKYTVDAAGSTYVFNFSNPDLAMQDVNQLAGLPRIVSYKMRTPKSVEVTVGDGYVVQHFVVGNKVILDIKDSDTIKALKVDKNNSVSKSTDRPAKPVKDIIKPALKSVMPAKAVVLPVKPDTAKPVILTKKIAEDAAKLSPNIVVERGEGDTHAAHKAVVAPVVTEDAAATPQAPVDPAPPTKPVVISITSTSSVPLVVYQRGGYLWVVEDREGVSTPPGVEGLGGASFMNVPAKGITVYRMKWPDNKPLYASGGGLIWKLSTDPLNQKEEGLSVLASQFGEDAPNGPQLKWTAKSIHRIAEFKDPDAGDTVKLVFVESVTDYIREPRKYTDLNILPSYIGAAFLPKVDDLNVVKTDEAVLITKPEGLVLSPQKDSFMSAQTSDKASKDAAAESQTRIFDFEKWRIGDKSAISDNQRLIMSGLSEQTDLKRAESLISLGHMMLSFGYAPEAMGYFDLAEQLLPDLSSSPEFVAAKAVAHALSGRSKEAFQILSTSSLSNINEVKYWKALSLADLDDWQQAAATLPVDNKILESYPEEVRNPLGLEMAEITLRQGHPDRARDILDILAKDRDTMPISYRAALDYLEGEYFRQKGKLDESKKLWEDLGKGSDDLYRAKSRFALSVLQLDNKDITIDKAIDNLEGLRYAWRGDDLETSINYTLAKMYLQKGEPMKALTLMKHAASLTPESEQGKKITTDLHDTFKGLFTPDNIKKLTPIDAMTVYNEFSDLVPKGAEGEKISRQLAERLVDADLLPRAVGLLEKQVDGDLKGLEGADVAIRLASLQVLDGKADKAVSALNKAETFLKDSPEADATPRLHDINILRAKALSLQGKPQDAFDALAKLPQDDAVLKMRADIAWQNKRWQDAADALEQVLGQQDISLTRPLTDDQAVTILNWAVALYLADNRYVLANLRERYADSMAQTPYAKKFDVITRPRQLGLLADRETIQSIVNETDMFKDFLTSIKQDPSKATTSPIAQTRDSAQDSGARQAIQTPVPEDLKSSPLLKTDEFRGD